MNQEYLKKENKLKKFVRALDWFKSILLLGFIVLFIVFVFFEMDNSLSGVLTYYIGFMLISSVLIIPILAVIASKLKKKLALEKINQIFNSSSEDEEDTYTFQIEEEEIEVQLDSTGVSIEEQHHSYEDYEITLSITGFRGILYCSLYFTKVDLEKKNEDYTIEDAFCIEMDARVYQALKQFKLNLDTQSKNILDLVKNDPEKAVKKLVRWYISILNFY